MRFADRTDAGRRLADEVEALELHDPVVLALPRGGVPVAYEVAVRLGAPMDVIVARKIGAPYQPELGVGAIAEGGDPVFDPRSLAMLGLSEQELESTVRAEQQELQRRREAYRGDRPLPSLEGRDVVLVDDGLATGVTARAALAALRARNPRRLVLAVPVAAPQTVEDMAGDADEIVVVHTPERFAAVGSWYVDFGQTTDAEVQDLLKQAGKG